VAKFTVNVGKNMPSEKLITGNTSLSAPLSGYRPQYVVCMVLAEVLYPSVDPYTPLAKNKLCTNRTKPNACNGCQDLRKRTVKGHQWEM
jgi:hypothetical protein